MGGANDPGETESGVRDVANEGTPVFFAPGDAFLTWLKAHAGDRPVFDVGCGSGLFTERMWAVGIKALGIDRRAYDTVRHLATRLRTLQACATDCQTLRDHAGLVLFCRPDHTGWVADAILKLHADSEVLYISKPGNRHVDLPEFKTEEVAAPGLKVERVYKVLKPYPRFSKPNYLFAGVERLLAMRDGNDMIGDD